MDFPSSSSVIIIGAGISGLSAAKVLAENGIEDLVILEASDRIGGRIRKENFGGVSVELGAGWIAGVGSPETPIELAIDFILHDFEMQVVREIQHSRNGVIVKTEDGSVYEANYVILSVSIGVLQSDLISFRPPLPKWKTEAIGKCDVMVYTKIFLKFPYKFWPCGPEKEFFIYAHERRGYYTFWQHMENAYPGSNVLVVTLTNGESKRVETQSDEETLKEAMQVLRDMFGPNIPNATGILVPRWWNNRFQRGSYSNYPIISNNHVLQDIKAPVGHIFFTGEHTSERFNGYVHGGYLSGEDKIAS
ncbi:hypothetical protein GH714_001828 [Hevea brasiliensis]|uniref:Amine oxidase domain-containing protein n=1 Tax=Hevea brasiliensis TaxID=3981 RepID=A0A6A6KWN6_HEVBR|nr:hypothetical protein GH714_001828 [Hevea brasiliensis]